VGRKRCGECGSSVHGGEICFFFLAPVAPAMPILRSSPPFPSTYVTIWHTNEAPLITMVSTSTRYAVFQTAAACRPHRYASQCSPACQRCHTRRRLPRFHSSIVPSRAFHFTLSRPTPRALSPIFRHHFLPFRLRASHCPPTRPPSTTPSVRREYVKSVGGEGLSPACRPCFICRHAMRHCLVLLCRQQPCPCCCQHKTRQRMRTPLLIC